VTSILGELKRRNVFRVAAAYAVAGWLLTEVASVVFPIFGAPDWVLRILVAMLIIGFPIALVFSWVYELTPEGIRREREVDHRESITPHTGRKLERVTVVMIVAAIGVVLADRFFWASEPDVADSAGQAVVETPVAGEETGGGNATNSTRARADSPRVISAELGPTDDRQSVAVLPFVNMSEDADNEYFSDGISEELLNVLVKIDDLRVPSRTSSFAFKGQNVGIPEIARQLGVEHVLEGSVRKAGEQIRVTAQLIDVATDTHLWSETYTRTLDDIFAIQDEIAMAIAAELRVALGAGEEIAGSGTRDAEAYNHYLKGRFFWHQRTPSSFDAAEEELRRAVEIDPGYADAWAALADIYVLMPEYVWGTMHEAIPKARAAVERALAINAESARALTTRAYLRFMYDYNHVGAEADFRDAIAIDPGYATAYQWYGEFLAMRRRPDEALTMAQKAADLDPLAPVKPLIIGNIHSNQGRFDAAEAAYAESLRLSPDWGNSLSNLTVMRIRAGRYEAALESLARFDRSLDPDQEVTGHVRAVIEAKQGKRSVDDAVKVVVTTPFGWCSVADKAMYLALLGDEKATLDMLETCIEAGDPYATYINHQPAFDELRDAPRFQALLARMNLSTESES